MLKEVPFYSDKMALGNEAFVTQVEALSGRRMTAKKMGRPVGWRKRKVGDSS